MSRAIDVRDRLRYLQFAEIYHRFSEPKTKRRAFAIFEGAIRCFEKKGFESVTLKMVAREAGVTSQLLKYYFTDLAEIRELALKYIRVIAQRLSVEAIAGEQSPPEILLRKYLEAQLYWVTHFKSHIRVWLHFLATCPRSPNAREMNSQAALAGTERIAGLLAKGRESGVFNHQDDHEVAKVIQTMINGWLVTLLTENFKDSEKYSRRMIDRCLAVVGTEV